MFVIWKPPHSLVLGIMKIRVEGEEEHESTVWFTPRSPAEPSINSYSTWGWKEREKENVSSSRIGCALNTRSAGTSELPGAVRLCLELTCIGKHHSHHLSQHAVQSLWIRKGFQYRTKVFQKPMKCLLLLKSRVGNRLLSHNHGTPEWHRPNL